MAGQAVDNDLYLKQVEERLQALEQRLTALERQSAAPGLPPQSLVERPPTKQKRTEGTTSIVPVLGKAVMAIGGAYLLRAIAESGSLPTLPLLLAAIAYSGAWLVWAARMHRKSPFASAVFALTSTFILAPVLWEGAVRFHQLSAGLVSLVLVGYIALSLALARREMLETIPSIALLTAVTTDFALLIATHDLAPLVTTLIAIAFIVETAALSGHWQGARAISALGANLAIAVLGLVMTSPRGVPASYHPMSSLKINALCLALPLVYTGSLVVRGFAMHKKWTVAEVIQATIAFGLGTWVTLRATQAAATMTLGALCILLALACYWGAFKRFGSVEMQRNRRVSLNFAAGLLLTGVFLLFEGDLRALLLSTAAVILTVAFTRSGQFTFAVHGAIYLLVAGIETGLLGFAATALAGTVPTWPHWTVWPATIAALLCYLAGSQVSADQSRLRVIWMIPSAIAALAISSSAVTVLKELPFADLSPSRLSMIRTIVTAVTALGLAYVGSRRNRLELGWLAYVAIAFGALKLLLEDLRFGNAGTLMVSLLIYGLILVLIPRVTQFGRVEL